ncbi:MAG: L-threonylcarbamoyladenylate synthase [Micrococcales bacterium]
MNELHRAPLQRLTTDIAGCAEALALGHLVAMPTETVYGLAADATSQAAVARIYEAKGRPSDHPLIVHFANSELIRRWAIDIPQYALALADTFWPGPLTLVLRRSELAGDFITGGQDTVALRVPGHATALELLTAFESLGGLGVAAPSANRFGKVSPTTAQAVFDELNQHLEPGDRILEGGSSRVGIESTIVDCTKSQPAILRPGAITAEQIREVTGLKLSERDATIKVSGNLASHYAPNARVVLNAAAHPGDGLIALAELATPEGVIRLAAPQDAEAFAAELYAALRKADELGLTRVVALAPVGSGIELAIEDRLRRAAARQT